MGAHLSHVGLGVSRYSAQINHLEAQDKVQFEMGAQLAASQKAGRKASVHKEPPTANF